MNALQSRLRALAASLDDAALEALGSRGLLRRARNDVQGAVPHVIDESGTVLLVRVGEYDVSIPGAGPAAATCTCPAAGICQHILGAVLHLRAGRDAVSLTDDARAEIAGELTGIALTELEEWAGRASFNAGVKLASESEADIQHHPYVRIGFPALSAYVRVVAGAGLDGMIVSGGRNDPRRMVVAAVIAYQRHAGDLTLPTPAHALVAATGTPRSRPEVIESCERLIEGTLSNGLSRLSIANQQRWVTLAVSALGVNLPRLAAALRAIGDDVSLILARDARADSSRAFARMAESHALCAALRTSGEGTRPDLVGVHRTQYQEVGNLDLMGVAAWPWSTASGLSGLTVLFWDLSARRWSSWSDSRPNQQSAGFEPSQRFDAPSPWDGADSPRQLARSTFRLLSARRNAWYRLSGSSSSRALVTGPSLMSENGPAPITSWVELHERSAAAVAIGLRERDPLDAIFALCPSAWGERDYDAVVQRFRWIVIDSAGQEVPLELTFDKHTGGAIRYLESVSTDVVDGAVIVGRAQRTGSGLTLHPLSIHPRDGGVVHLGLDPVAASPSARATTPAADDAVVDVEEETVWTEVQGGVIGRLIAEVADALLACAESGVGASNASRMQRVMPLVARAERLGLRALAAVLGQLVARPTARQLLRCGHVSALYSRGAS